MKLVVIIDVRPEKLPEFMDLATYHAANSRAELGCISFELHRDSLKENRFVLVEEFASSWALDYHRGTPHYRRWAKEIVDLQAGPRTRLELEPIGKPRLMVTPGCFDLLHPGHVHLLTQAKAAGDKLIVLLNSDASVRRLKGEGRPIQNQDEREAMLRALRVVDDVIVFDDDNPARLIEQLQPCVLVKGAEPGRAIPEMRPGQELLIIRRLPDISTTNRLAELRLR